MTRKGVSFRVSIVSLIDRRPPPASQWLTAFARGLCTIETSLRYYGVIIEGDVLILPALGSVQQSANPPHGDHIPARVACRHVHDVQFQLEGEDLPHGLPFV